MANVIIDESSLYAIADAIRDKLEVETTYKPSEMAEAIESISSGGITPTGTIEITQNGVVDVTNYASADVDVSGGVTPTGTKQISITQNGTTTEDVTNYASTEITANVPNSYAQSDEGKVVSSGALVSQTSDTVTANDTYDTTLINSLTVNVSGGDPNENLLKLAKDTLTSIILDFEGDNVKERLFNSAKALLTARLLNMGGSSGQYIFYNCTNLQTAVLYKTGTAVAIPSYTFGSCTKLTAVDITGMTFGSGSACNGASALNTIIIRNSSVASLGNINVFTNTPFASGKAGGTLYVPNDLISSYQSASNWNTILGYSTNSIQKIEGSIYETAYADGTPIS